MATNCDNIEIIDVHVHLSRTIEEDTGYHPVPGRRAMNRYATPERMLQFMDREEVSKVVFLTLPPGQYRGPLARKAELGKLPEAQRREEQSRINDQIGPVMRSINEWGCGVGRKFPNLTPFVCIAPELGGTEGMLEELLTRVRQGAKGVKLHPGEFAFFPDDKVMWPVYEKCQEMGIPILSDSAPYTYQPFALAVSRAEVLFSTFWTDLPKMECNYGEPKNFAAVLKAFPQLTLVMAHLGGPWWDERIELAKEFPNIYFDTAQGFTAPDQVPINPHRGLAEEDVVRVMRKIGVDRIMFGTDNPSLPFQTQLEQILRLSLSDKEKRMILAENAKRILHI